MSDLTTGREPPTATTSSTDWLLLCGVAVAAAALGGAIAWKVRGDRAQFRLDAHADPGSRAFFDVVVNGVRDDKVQRKAPGGPELAALQKSFDDAQVLGISPTELAVSGRYFGDESVPVHFSVGADGGVLLRDVDRNRYEAAKGAGALAILADVVQKDFGGDVVAERRAAVRLL